MSERSAERAFVLSSGSYSIDSGVTNGDWDTTDDMPDPADVIAAIKGARRG